MRACIHSAEIQEFMRDISSYTRR